MRVYFVTIGLLFALLVGGILVDRLYRRFAARHPELGPYRDSQKGCGCCSSRCRDERCVS